MTEVQAGRHIGKLSFDIDPAALREIISNGRLSEFVSVATASAAAQISGQIVNQVAAAALSDGDLSTPLSIACEFALDGAGGYGLHPPLPRPPVLVAVLVDPNPSLHPNY
jgi:hypothetical protein